MYQMSLHSPRPTCLILSAVLGLIGLIGSGCGNGPSDAGPPAPLAVTIGAPADCEDGFVALAPGDALELFVGFQGWQFVQLRYHVAEADALPPARSVLALTIDGKPARMAFAELPLEVDPAGGMVTGVDMIFLSDVLVADIVGRSALLELGLSDDGGRTGEANVMVELRDDDPTIHNGSCGVGGTDAAIPDGGQPDAATADGG